MNSMSFALISACVLMSAALAEEIPTMTFTADRIAVDNVTKAAVATGHVVAVQSPMTLRSESLVRDEKGVMRFCDPTCITTCSNAIGHTHWNLTGEVEFKQDSYAILRNVWLKFYEIPVCWLPYFYYPLDGDFALRVMPGYLESWGAYILTKTVYDIVGDSAHRDNTWWLHGNTRFDLRYENGVALGQTLYWNLGDFGKGKFKVYYAWDENYDEYNYSSYRQGGRNWGNWSSNVNRDRYAIELTHRWDPTENDVVRVRGLVVSDMHFRDDFFRENMFNIKNEWIGQNNNELAWEHNGQAYAYGISASGPLNNFYGGTAQLPEFYFDLHPTPVWGLPVNYETENRVGYLARQAAEYGNGSWTNPYSHNPGVWADYESFRLDTYHRLSAPFRTLNDVLSVVPRIGYHGTWWNQSGKTDLTGWNEAENEGNMVRSILEGGVTFAARGTASIDEKWQHLVEPYLDVLAQKAWYDGIGDGARPYVFDDIDSSRMWEDQFAGRARNLPYTYYGVTPGLRNALNLIDEKGRARQVFDIDVYAALQFSPASHVGDDDYHKLADPDSPNYGKDDVYVMPGSRIRWTPDKDIMFLGRAEYDSDYNKLALADIGWQQRVSKNFDYRVKYAIRDHRWWDFSSSPYDPTLMRRDEFNWAHFHYVEVGFTQQPIDWFAWSPFVRWDCKNGELDTAGAWFDYLTDCLGFRFLVSYDNEYTRMDGYHRSAEWGFGFFIYLRAFGADGMSQF